MCVQLARCIFCGAIVGAGLGFSGLILSSRIFMGDIGSLGLGAAGTVGLYDKTVVIIMGGVLVLETMSVILRLQLKLRKRVLKWLNTSSLNLRLARA